MNISASKIILLLTLLILVSLSACGSRSTSSHSPFSNTPQGRGTDPEPGTDGKPRPLPSGHSESIVVANGLAFIGSDNGTLYALGTHDGKVHWQQKVGPSVLVFAVVNGAVYIAADQVVYAFNASKGTLLWQYWAAKLISQLLVADGGIYVNTAAEGDSSTLYALRATDGSLQWSYSLSTTMPGLVGVSNGTLYDVQSSGLPGDSKFHQTLYALRTSDAHVIWHALVESTDGLVSGTVVEVNAIIYLATTHGAIYALHADTGMRLWHAAQPGGQDFSPVFVSPTVVHGVVYIGDAQGVSAFRASDGVRLWQYKEALSDTFASQPVVVGGVVYVSLSGGLIGALRASNGVLLWQHQGEGVFRPLTVVDGLVINDSGPVSALRASDGAQLWQRSVEPSEEGSDAAPPEVVGEGIVLIGLDSGGMQAIRISDGKLLWHYMIQELAVQMPPVYSAFVTFTASTSYGQALQIVTDLGLKTFADCRPVWWTAGDDKTGFAAAHVLTVAATVNSAPLWLDRLNATAGVERAEAEGPHSCPSIGLQNGPRYLSPEQAGTFVRVTFAEATAYMRALDAMNTLGFRLADPCYEQARAKGAKPTWHPMGQADSFGKMQTLLLATTFFNATIWASQLGASAGVVKIEAPFTMSC